MVKVDKNHDINGSETRFFNLRREFGITPYNHLVASDENMVALQRNGKNNEISFTE